MKPIEKWTHQDDYMLYSLYGIIPDKFNRQNYLSVMELIEKLLNHKCPCGCGLEISTYE